MRRRLPDTVAGLVVGQISDPGTTVDRLAVLTVIVSAAESPAEGDPVSPTTTVSALQAAGFLHVVVKTGAPSQVVSIGQVYEQHPAPGSVVDPAKPVTLHVKAAAPASLTKAPSLIGMTLEAALSALSAAGFSSIHAEPGAGPGATPGVASGHAAAQDPKPGLFADPNSPFRFWLNGPPPGYVSVPALVGKKSADVGTTLKGAGLVGSVTIDPSAKNPVGVVLTQSPAAGTWMKPGGMVHWTYRSN